MKTSNFRLALIVSLTTVVAGGTMAPASCSAQEIDKRLLQALKITPKQEAAKVDTPSEAEMAKCKLKELTTDDDKKGWLVLDESDRPLRRFVDRNGDTHLDLLSFYKNGIEVYRDIDADFDRHFEQYRWMGTAGTRWGIDENKDRQIDRWKSISAEEVSFEVVEAIKSADVDRFTALLLSKEEIDSLGLGSTYKKEVTERIKKASEGFAAFVRSQKLIGKDSNWIHFGGILPGIIPAGTNGSDSDVTIYDSVAAVIDNGGRSHAQLSIGTLVKYGDAWRLIDLPEPIVEGVALTNGALFFQSDSMVAGYDTTTAGGGVTEADQKLFERYDELDKEIASAKSNQELQKLNEQRAELFQEMIASSKSPENQSNWARQMADMVTASYQQGDYDGGLKFMQEFLKSEVKTKGLAESDLVYSKYRVINSFYSRKIREATTDELTDLQDEYMKKLEQFVDQYPKDSNSADAMLQLAMDDEADGDTNEAKDWYGRIVREFPKANAALRAKGAAVRLGSEGNKIALKGQTLEGRNFDLSSLEGKVVIVQYWATWSDTCENDMKAMKEAYSEYSRRGLEVVSVSMDYEEGAVKEYLRKNTLPWTHLYADGNLDSPLALQLGINMVPTILLVGSDGKVIDRNVLAQDIDRLLDRQFNRSAKRDE